MGRVEGLRGGGPEGYMVGRHLRGILSEVWLAAWQWVRWAQQTLCEVTQSGIPDFSVPMTSCVVPGLFGALFL